MERYKAQQLGVGIELNKSDMSFSDTEADMFYEFTESQRNAAVSSIWEAMPTIQIALITRNKFSKGP